MIEVVKLKKRLVATRKIVGRAIEKGKGIELLRLIGRARKLKHPQTRCAKVIRRMTTIK